MTDPLSRLRAEVKAAENPRCSAKETLAMAQTATRLARAVADEATVEKLIEPLDKTYCSHGQKGALRSAALSKDHYEALIKTVLTALASLGLGEE